jgi:hypothetical protein
MRELRKIIIWVPPERQMRDHTTFLSAGFRMQQHHLILFTVSRKKVRGGRSYAGDIGAGIVNTIWVGKPRKEVLGSFCHLNFACRFRRKCTHHDHQQ